MATIYYADNGEFCTQGLQGSDVCDEAWQIASCLANYNPDQDYILEDADGVFIFSGDSHRRIGEEGEEWAGSGLTCAPAVAVEDYDERSPTPPDTTRARNTFGRSVPTTPGANTMKTKLKTGDILYWIIVDATTGEPVMVCQSRKQAREHAKGCNARICKVEVTK